MGHEAVWNSHPKGYGPGSRTCKYVAKAWFFSPRFCKIASNILQKRDFEPTKVYVMFGRVCGNSCGMIRKYGINTCRQCFRIYSKDIGFVKYR